MMRQIAMLAVLVSLFVMFGCDRGEKAEPEKPAQEVGHNLNTMKDDLEHKAGEAVETMKQKVGQTAETVEQKTREVVGTAQEKAQEVAEGLKSEGLLKALAPKEEETDDQAHQ